MDKEEAFPDMISLFFPLISFFHQIFKADRAKHKNGYKSLSRLFLLAAIEKQKVQTVAEMAAFFHLKKSTLSELLSRMEDDRLLVRQINRADRRQYIFTLTSQARKSLREFERQFQNRVQGYLCRMPEDKRKNFFEALEEVKRSLSFINCLQEGDHD